MNDMERILKKNEWEIIRDEKRIRIEKDSLDRKMKTNRALWDELEFRKESLKHMKEKFERERQEEIQARKDTIFKRGP